MKNILIVDGNSIINRAFYGIRSLQNSRGHYTNAIYGAVNMISRQMEQLSPEYAAVAFDLKEPTFRHKMYAEYKQGRHPTPPELSEQFAPAKEVLCAMGLTTLELPGWEADDIQGTVAKMAVTEPDCHAYILTGDRDLLQLIDENTTVLLASTGETSAYDEKAFTRKYGVPPIKLIDLKALMGDSSDNIPGVPGIGEKTAVKLISLFGSLQALYDYIDENTDVSDECRAAITESVRRKLTEGKEKAFMSYDLATIRTNAPLSHTLDDLKYTGIENDLLYRLCVSLELRSFIRKFKLSAPASSADEINEASAPLHDSDRQSTENAAVKESPDTAKTCVNIQNPFPVACDAEAASAKEILQQTKESFCAAVADDALLIYCPGDKTYRISCSDPGISTLFNGSRTVVCYDAKALHHHLRIHGIEMNAVPHDVMLEGYVMRGGDGAVKPSALALSLLGVSAEDSEISPEMLYRMDCIIRQEKLNENELKLTDEIELPLASVLFDMEKTGFKIDRSGITGYGERLRSAAEALTERIYTMAAHPFNINSTKQLAEVLYDELGLKAKKKTKSGYSTDAETLESLRFIHPIVDDILSYRQITKLYSTYAVGLANAADINDRIHTDFKQALTATGRLSSAEPNLQNIPVRTELGREIRRFFIPDEGCVLVDADYSQIELRLLAAFSDDDSMCQAFLDGEDIHARTAALVFGVPLYAVTPELRKRAKAVNFGIIYGIGAHSLSLDLGCTHAQAQAYIDAYMASFPSIGEYLRATVEKAEKDGYTTTMFGRKRMIPELMSPKASMRAFGRRVAMNSPIQGSAADIMKIAMLRVHRRLREEIPSASLVMQVHDELIIETPAEHAEKTAALLRQEMQKAVTLRVPLTAEAAVGMNWLEAK